jgi:hypothetical protein
MQVGIAMFSSFLLFIIFGIAMMDYRKNHPATDHLIELENDPEAAALAAHDWNEMMAAEEGLVTA